MKILFQITDGRLLCALTWWHKVSGQCQPSFIRAVILSLWVLPSWPNHYPYSPISNSVILRIRFLTYIIGDHKHPNYSKNPIVLEEFLDFSLEGLFSPKDGLNIPCVCPLASCIYPYFIFWFFSSLNWELFDGRVIDTFCYLKVSGNWDISTYHSILEHLFSHLSIIVSLSSSDKHSPSSFFTFLYLVPAGSISIPPLETIELFPVPICTEPYCNLFMYNRWGHCIQLLWGFPSVQQMGYLRKLKTSTFNGLIKFAPLPWPVYVPFLW